MTEKVLHWGIGGVVFLLIAVLLLFVLRSPPTKTKIKKTKHVKLPMIPKPSIMCNPRKPTACLVTLTHKYRTDLTVRFSFHCYFPGSKTYSTSTDKQVIVKAGTLGQAVSFPKYTAEYRKQHGNPDACSWTEVKWSIRRDPHRDIHPHQLYHGASKQLGLPRLPWPTVKCTRQACRASIPKPYPKTIRILYSMYVTCPNAREVRFRDPPYPTSKEFSPVDHWVEIPAGQTDVTTPVKVSSFDIRGCTVTHGWSTKPVPNHVHVWIPELYPAGGCRWFASMQQHQKERR